MEWARGQGVRKVVADCGCWVVSVFANKRWFGRHCEQGSDYRKEKRDVLIRGSVPGPFPFLRFIIRAVVENGDAVADVMFVVRLIGALGRSTPGIGYFAALAGRRTGRKVEKFIVGGAWW